MLVLNIPVFICILFVQVTTKNFLEGTLIADFPGRGPFGRSLTHDDYQTFAAIASKFLQVGINIFDRSDQTCPKYPVFLKYIKKKFFWILLLCKTFRCFTGFQSCLFLLIFLHSQTVCIFCLNTTIQ